MNLLVRLEDELFGDADKSESEEDYIDSTDESFDEAGVVDTLTFSLACAMVTHHRWFTGAAPVTADCYCSKLANFCQHSAEGSCS